MSLVAISGNASGTGTLTIAAPNTNSNYTLNLPAATGTVMVSGNMPAFSAYQSVAQTITGSTFTKVTFTTEEFDTNNNFASSTFTPTVAGYYQLNAQVSVGATTITRHLTMIYKNGVLYKIGTDLFPSAAASSRAIVSSLVYANGTTDYFDVYVYAGGTGTINTTASSVADTYFNGSLVRGA